MSDKARSADNEAALNESSNRIDRRSRLLLRAQAGDGEALSELLHEYRRYLKLLARLFIHQQLQSKADPSDLVQETYVEAFRSFCGFQGETTEQFVHWLKRILASRGADLGRRFLRAKGRDVRREENLVDALDASSACLDRFADNAVSSPSANVQRQEMAVQLADALNELSSSEREVIIRHGLEGISISQIALDLGRTESAVWKSWARGLLKLRDAMAD